MDTCMHGGVSAKDENEWKTVFNKRQSQRREKSQVMADIPDGTKAATKISTGIGSTLQRRPSGRSGPGSGHSSRSSSKPSSRHHSTSDAGSPRATIKHEQSKGKGDNFSSDVQQMKVTRDLLQTVAHEIPKDAWRWVFRELIRNSSKHGEEERLIESVEVKYEKDLDEQKFQALVTWQKCVGSKATVDELDQALRKHDCASVADKHITGVSIAQATDGAIATSASGANKGSSDQHASSVSKNHVMEPLVTTSVAVQESTDGPVMKTNKKKATSPEFELRRVSVDESNIEVSQEGNKITLSMPSHILQKCKAGAESSSYDDKSCIAAMLIANIINPNNSKHSYGMKLSELASRFEEKHGTHLKFRNLGVGKLKPFIDQSDWFTLHKNDDSDEYIVEQTAPTPSPSTDSGVSSMFNNRGHRANVDSDSEYEYGTAMHSPPETPFRTPDGSARRIFNPKPIDIEIGLNECLSAELLGSLLKKPPSRFLKFVLETEYQDKLKFTHDIVSLWNTPESQTKYIVVGVSPKRSPPHESVGLTEVKQDKYYQDLFREEAFSYKPPFKYSELLYVGKRYGVFVIPSSKGCGYHEPCYADRNDPSGRWQQENICHCNPRNAIAGRKATQRIIKWFAGSLSEMPTSPKEEEAEEWNKEWDYIRSHVAGLARDRIPSLVLSRCNPDTRYLGSLGNFPWVKVWDFDPQSKSSGVLKACLPEDASDPQSKASGVLKACRPEDASDRVKVSTWKDPVADSYTDGTTDWVFVRGLEDKADSRMDAKEPRKWFNKIKGSLNAHCKHLAQHCQSKEKPPFVVVLWYDNFQYISHLTRLLQKIDEETEDTEFLLIMPNLPKQSANLQTLREQLEIEHIAQIPLANLCHNLYHCACPFQSDTGGTFLLPVSNGTYDADINDQEFHWYNEEIEILYSSHASQEMWSEAKLGERFFAGRLLQWSECELGIGMIDVKRSIYKRLMQNVMNCLRTQKSATIKLFHEPSSGGTTLGRRILWDLHLVTPCACVSATTFKPAQVLERLESLNQKTQLPIVLLVDGAEEKLVKEVESDERYQKKPTVILHVQQHSGEMGGKVHGANQHLLTAKVDYMEAMSLLHVFSHSCSKETLVKLRKLVEEVKEGKPHYMHEFKQIHEVQKG